ncbi:RNA-binding protein, predicted [Enterocytozoon bieneusi H348]|nr:RNA-binding protein, predicted [Enterocytozoon bieneusi H348]|eukprot:XP_002649924.1 RNA-binding protein, predicted [Enterocytozoon bieneusi H348]
MNVDNDDVLNSQLADKNSETNHSSNNFSEHNSSSCDEMEINKINLPKISDNDIKQAQKVLEEIDESELNDDNDCIDSEEQKVDDDSYTVDKNDDIENYTVFIKNLNYDLRDTDLRNEFSKLGKIIRLDLSMNYKGLRNNGYAFIEFADKKAFDLCLQLHNTELFGRTVVIEKAKPVSPKLYSVFIKNLPFSIKKDDLKETFSKFGKIHNISIPEDKENEGRNKGFGFIDFVDKKSAELASKANIFIQKRKCICELKDSKNKFNETTRKKMDNLTKSNFKSNKTSRHQQDTFNFNRTTKFNASKKTKINDNVSKSVKTGNKIVFKNDSSCEINQEDN